MICFPVAISYFGWTSERIEDLLNLLVLHGFWRLVVDDLGQKAIYIERFGDHQTLRADQDKNTNFLFSNGVENSAAFSPQEWRAISEIPPNLRGLFSAETPRKLRADSAETPRPRGKQSTEVKSREVKLNTMDDPADPPVRAEKKRPKKETRWKTSQAIDAHRLVIGDPDYGRGKLPGPDLGGLRELGCLDLVEDLNLFWNRSANYLQGKGMTVSIAAIVRSIAYLDPSGLPRRANGNGAEPASRSARSAQDVLSTKGITDGS